MNEAEPITHEMFFFSAASASLRCNFPMALKMKKSPANPLECTLTRKCAANSFGIHSYKFKGLKLPWNDTPTKIRGEGASALVANTRLKPHFPRRGPDQSQIIGLKFESRGTKTFKRYRGEAAVKICSPDPGSGGASGSDILKGFSEREKCV
jgi:hypothetical protein